MDRMSRSCKSVYTFAIISTVVLCLSAIGFILSMFFDIVPLFFTTIALIIASLIGTIALWYIHSEISFVCSIIECIEEKSLFDTYKIARCLNTNKKVVEESILFAMKRGCITLYTLEGSNVIEKTPRIKVNCQGCKAKVLVAKDYPKCPYCGSVFDIETEMQTIDETENTKNIDTSD